MYFWMITSKHKEKITELASTGARVLVFGTYAAEIDGKALTEPVTPLAISYLRIQSVRRQKKHSSTLQSRELK